jgi:cell division protein FtsW (lipid II flippase)
LETLLEELLRVDCKAGGSSCQSITNFAGLFSNIQISRFTSVNDKINQTSGDKMSFINRYSFLIVSGVAALLLGFFLFRKRVDSSSLITFGALILGLLLAFFLLRPKSSPSQEVDEILDQIGTGQPVLLQFQSEY